MSRLVSTQRHSRRSPATVRSRQGQPSQLEQAALTVHRECMILISNTIASEAEPGAACAEKMALLLACAQSAQSLATLVRLESPRLNLMLSACIEHCTACIDAFAHETLLDACRTCIATCVEKTSRC